MGTDAMNPNPAEGATPRTDSNITWKFDNSDTETNPSEFVAADFARQLERELTEANRRIAELEGERK